MQVKTRKAPVFGPGRRYTATVLTPLPFRSMLSPMCAMNAEEILAVVGELQSLRGSKIKRVHQPEERTIVLDLRHSGRNRFLLISADNDQSRLHLTDKKPPNPRIPYGFVSLLRARLSVARLDAIESAEGERLVLLDFEALVDGGRSGFRLACELTGRHANIFLLDEKGAILGSIRPNRSNKRRLVAGRSYTPPFPLSKPGRDQHIRFSPGGGDFPINAGAERAFGDEAGEFALRLRTNEARRIVRRKLKRTEKAERALETELHAAELAPVHRLWADLLQIDFKKLKPGLERIELEDIISPGGGGVTVELDPRLSPRDNIEALYKRAKKGDRAKPVILDRMKTISDEHDRLLRLGELLDEDTPEATDRVRGILGLDLEAPRSRIKEKKALPYRRFVSAKGREIRVGKGARENDLLTFRHSKGGDFWFHATGYSGSHVVVPMPRASELDPETLLDAAALAAHYSKAKGGAVEVAYTRVKHVKKAGKGKPGLVSLSNQKTVFVEHGEERIRRLMSGGSETSP